MVDISVPSGANIAPSGLVRSRTSTDLLFFNAFFSSVLGNGRNTFGRARPAFMPFFLKLLMDLLSVPADDARLTTIISASSVWYVSTNASDPLLNFLANSSKISVIFFSALSIPSSWARLCSM